MSLSFREIARLMRYQILDFSKVESGRLDLEAKAINLAACLDQFSKIFSFSARQKKLSYSIDNRLSPATEVLADSGRIRQVLANLIGNSIKFTAERGRISLVAWYEATEIGVTAKFVVEDTGVGVKPETLRTLFQPFSQGDSSTARIFGGTGLGLAISKSVSSGRTRQSNVMLMYGSLLV